MLLFNVIYHLKLNSTVLLLLTEVSFNVVSILDIRVVIANALFATILFQFKRRYLIFLSTPRLFEKKAYRHILQILSSPDGHTDYLHSAARDHRKRGVP